MCDINIERVENGYIIRDTGMSRRTEVFLTLDEVFTRLLSRFEGRAECYKGKYHGKVTIVRGKDEPASGGV